MKKLNPISLTMPSAQSLCDWIAFVFDIGFFMDKTEIWKDIEDYESIYKISNLGRVLSLKRTVTNKRHSKNTLSYHREKILKSCKDKSGYMHLVLCNNSLKSFRIHRLIAKAFIPNPENKPCINHKNGIKTDNRIENLEWCTYKENNKHAVDNNLLTHAIGEKSGMAKLTEKEVIQIREKHSRKSHTIRELSTEYNVAYTTIWGIVKRIYWKHLKL